MNAIRMLPSVLVVAATILVILSVRDSRAEIDSGTVTTVRTHDKDTIRKIRIYSYVAPGFDHGEEVDRCLIVIHGMGRSAKGYFKVWKPIADKYRAFLIVPEFGKESWPYSRHFNWGNVLNKAKALKPAQVWGFSLLHKGVDLASERAGLSCRQFFLYGHSGGAQFVHRYVMFTGGKRVIRAVAANAGYYLWPDPDRNYPYGLKRLEPLALTWEKAFQSELTVMIGSDDVDPNHKSLRQTKGVTFQGPTRLHRALKFFIAAREFASEQGVPFSWRLETVPGVRHSNRQIAPFAAYELFER